MAIRFKFRSSPNFDAVDIEGRPSISIRDLKSKIVRDKKLSICQDFDLVFSDALTGQEYKDEAHHIPTGSSVIIKRMPAELVPSNKTPVDRFQSSEKNVVKTSFLDCADDIDFDDFGTDLCPVPKVLLTSANSDVQEKICVSHRDKNTEGRRSLEPIMIGCPKNGSNAHCEGPSRFGIKENIFVKKSKPNVEPFDKLGKVVNASIQAIYSANLSSELKCSLCNMLFKEAVMIPCCQHSFCQKCITSVMVEKGRCPKCYSIKFGVEDLLPNLSLRQAIDHFLESQILISGSGNSFNQYAPDEESGVQVKEVPHDVVIHRREPDMPHSSSATGKGSNQIAVEPLGGTASRPGHLGSDKSLKTLAPSPNMKHKVGRPGFVEQVVLRGEHEDLTEIDDFQGESQPMHEEVKSNVKQNQSFGVNASGAEQSFTESGRHKKGVRTCYMCGSPGHFIRDCPTAHMSHPMFQTENVIFPRAIPGYPSLCWKLPTFPQGLSFGNVYGNHDMMPFNATAIPSTPFAVPAYMPSIFGSYAAYGGFMRMGGATTPVKNGADRNLCRSNASNVNEFEKRWKHSSEATRRELDFDHPERDGLTKTRHANDRDRSGEHKQGKAFSFSEGSLSENSQEKHRYDNHIDDASYSIDEQYGKKSRYYIGGKDYRRSRHSEKSNSLVEDIPSNTSRNSEERHRHRRTTSKNHKRKLCGSDSSWTNHPVYKEKDVKRRRSNSDAKRDHKNHLNSSKSDLEPGFSTNPGKKQNEKKSNHGSQHSEHRSKPRNNEYPRDRWQMAGGSDEDGGKEYRNYKRGRNYQTKQHRDL